MHGAIDFRLLILVLFSQSVINTTFPHGKEISLPCRSKSAWLFNGQPIEPGKDGRVKLEKKRITIKLAEYEDTGNYSCATRRADGTLELIRTYNVKVGPPLQPVNRRIDVNYEDHYCTNRTAGQSECISSPLISCVFPF